MKPLHWHVLGAGAMGCLFADALAQAGNRVTLVLRPGSPRGDRAITVQHASGSRCVTLATTEACDEGPIRHLLVTTKAYDVCAAVASIQHRLDESSQVLLLVNGMGYARELAAAMPWLQPYFGTTTAGAYRIAPGTVCHAGRGVTRIGRAGQVQEPGWFTSWSEAIAGSEWTADIELALWEKLAVNCAINPLTAVHRCPNGKLASDPELARQVEALCEEIAGIGHAAGMAKAVADLRGRVFSVIEGTAGNRSSMLQDILAGRRTEIDYINGYLVDTAGRLGVEARLNRGLLDAVKDLPRE